ncbi:MAG: ceramide glucosyltransferase [Hyphomicrobium sp.]|nr:ceramide glucosyltransferase [Hyphomicrobium sp.]
MEALALFALIFAAVATLLHLISTAVSLWRLRKIPSTAANLPAGERVTIIRPVCGVDPFERLTLCSTFKLDYRDYDIIFCSASEQDPVVPLVRALMAEHPHVRAQLLIGDDRSTPNPKLNNLMKGWRAATAPWIVMADSNVLMPKSYIDDLFQAWRPDTGLVCSPPIGSHPQGFWAELECAFLNTYQARWQLSADAVGFGFAQGKSMLWRRHDLEQAGGIRALALEIAEDAAATKIVRGRGKVVRLVDRPFPQPIGRRSARQVWDRQVRWARLRRATFVPYYLMELLTGSLFPIVAGVYAAADLGIDPFLTGGVLGAIWFGAEAVLARAGGWHISAWSPAAWLVRDLALPVLWLQGFAGNRFTWRGTHMTVADTSAVSQS